jgi:transposase-like protein
MARLLRVEQGLTVDQLAVRLALPRSTIYYWVRDLPLRHRSSGERPSPEPPSRDIERGVRAGGEPQPRRVSRARSEAAYAEGLESFDELAAQPTFRDFVCLYIVQGETRDRTRVALSNSDPAVMRLVSRWLKRLSEKSSLLSLQYRPGQSLNDLRHFWSETVGVQARAIRVRGTAPGEPAPEPERAQPASLHSRNGVLTVTVEDALLRARLQGWMQRTREGWL